MKQTREERLLEARNARRALFVSRAHRRMEDLHVLRAALMNAGLESSSRYAVVTAEYSAIAEFLTTPYIVHSERAMSVSSRSEWWRAYAAAWRDTILMLRAAFREVVRGE